MKPPPEAEPEAEPEPENKPAELSAEELAQHRRFAKLSFAEKVRWLEMAHRLALRLGARKEPPPPKPEN